MEDKKMLYGLKHRDYRTINYTEDLDEAYNFVQRILDMRL